MEDAFEFSSPTIAFSPLLSSVPSEYTLPPIIPYPGSQVQAWAQKSRTTALLATVLPHDQTQHEPLCYLLWLRGAHYWGPSLFPRLPGCQPPCLPTNSSKNLLTTCYVSRSTVNVWTHAILPPCDTEIIYQNGISSWISILATGPTNIPILKMKKYSFIKLFLYGI